MDDGLLRKLKLSDYLNDMINLSSNSNSNEVNEFAKQSAHSSQSSQEHVRAANHNPGPVTYLPADPINATIHSPQNFPNITLTEAESELLNIDKAIKGGPYRSPAESKIKKFTPYSDLVTNGTLEFPLSAGGRKASTSSKISVFDQTANSSEKEFMIADRMLEDYEKNKENQKASVSSDRTSRFSKGLANYNPPSHKSSSDKDYEAMIDLMLQEDLKAKEAADSSPKITDVSNYKAGFSFATANGKDLQVNPAQLKKVQELLSQEDSKSSTQKGEERKAEEQKVASSLDEQTPRFKSSMSRGMLQNKNSLQDSLKVFDEDNFNWGQASKGKGSLGNEGMDQGFGFATAGGRSIAVDFKRLEASKKLLETTQSQELTPSDDKSTAANQESHVVTSKKVSVAKSNVSSKGHLGGKCEHKSLKQDLDSMFETAGGKKLEVDAASYKATEKFFEEDSSFMDDFQEFNFKRNEANKLMDTGGFTTAGGKGLVVDKKKMEASRLLFEDSLENSPGKQTGGFSFATAGGKKLEVDSKRLKATAALFEDFDEDPVFEPKKAGNKDIKSKPIQPKGNFEGGFTTASNKGLVVDPKKLEASKLLFEDSPDQSPSKQAVGFSFATAGGKKLEVDSKRLKATEALFEDFDDDLMIGQGKKGKQESLQQKGTSEVGFTTASNKGIAVDPKRLEASRMLFEDSPDQSPSKQAVGFSFATAGGKKLEVDSKRLKATEALFEEFDEDPILHGKARMKDGKSIPIQQKSNFEGGFTTASNKGLTIDPKRLEASRMLLEETPTHSPSNELDDGQARSGTSTGNKNTQTKSQKSQFLFTNADDSKTKSVSNSKEKPHQKSSNDGFFFTTGGGGALKIDANMLEKSKKLFALSQEEEENSNHSSSVKPKEEESKPQGARVVIAPNQRSYKKIGIPNQSALQRALNLFASQDESDEHSSFSKKEFLDENSNEKKGRQRNQATANFNERSNGAEMVSENTNSLSEGVKKNFKMLKEESDGIPMKSMKLNNKQVVSVGSKTKDSVSGVFPFFIAYELTNVAQRAFNFVKNEKKSNNFADLIEEKDEKSNPFEGIKRNSDDISRMNLQNSKSNLLSSKLPTAQDTKYRDRESFLNNLKVQIYLEKKQKAKKSHGANNLTCYQNKERRKSFSAQNIPSNALEITVSNAADYQIPCPCIKWVSFENSQKVHGNFSQRASFECYCDGSFLIEREKLREILIKEGLRPDYMTQNWFTNHYKMVVWKFASKMRFFENCPNLLDLNTIKTELEYRYFLENFEAKRSIVKRILERDAKISSHMVLLIGEIKLKEEEPRQKTYIIELSDGWYSLYSEVKYEIPPARTGAALASNNALITKLIKEGKISTGTKIDVCGLQFKNKAGPQACNPLEIPESYAPVELSYNSIKRARWNAKLGEVPGKFVRKSLKSLRLNGGLVSMIDAFVEKKYPLVERTQGGMKQVNARSLDEESRGKNGRWGGFLFRLKLRDASYFYTQTEDRADPYVEMEVSHWVLEWYEKINEGDRVLFCNVKTAPRYDKNFSYFDFQTYTPKSNYIFLQTTNQSVMQSFSELKLPKSRYQEIKEYGKALASQSLMLHDFEVPCSISEQIFYAELKGQRNEIDVAGVVLEYSGITILGVLSTEIYFILDLHNKNYFMNLRLPLAQGAVIYFKNCQFVSREFVNINDSREQVFVLRTNENSCYVSSSAALDQERKSLEKLKVEELKERGQTILVQTSKKKG